MFNVKHNHKKSVHI